MKQKWILYQTTNLVNGKIYVGVHKVANTSASKRYLGSGDKLKAAVKKYGRESFVRKTLAEFNSCVDVYAAEAEIVTEDFVKRLDTYNICLGGRGGINLTEEMKDNLSRINKGNKYNLGKTASEATRAKLSAAHKGKLHSDETKAKISAGNKGKVISQDSKIKMSASKIGDKNCRSISVVINGVYYPSVRFAEKMENVSDFAIHARVKSNSQKWVEWRYATYEEKLLHNCS